MWQMAFTMLTDTTLPDTNLQSLTKVNQKSHVQRAAKQLRLVAFFCAVAQGAFGASQLEK